VILQYAVKIEKLVGYPNLEQDDASTLHFHINFKYFFTSLIMANFCPKYVATEYRWLFDSLNVIIEKPYLTLDPAITE
jgi:hypothetical protein